MLLNCNKEDCNPLDCEQSLFFFRFSKRSARTREVERRSRETRRHSLLSPKGAVVENDAPGYRIFPPK